MGSGEERAKALAELLKSKRQESASAASRVAMSRDIVAEQIPGVWEDLIEEFEDYCENVNEQVNPERKLAVHRTGPHDFMVRPDAMPEIVQGHYAYDTRAISIRNYKGVEWYLPKVYLVGTGSIHLVSKSTGHVTNLDAIAQNAIDDAMLRNVIG